MARGGITSMRLGAGAAWEGVEPREGVVSGWRGLRRRPGGSDVEGWRGAGRAGGTARRAGDVTALALAFRRRSILVTPV
jgi:hypothetical protein